ncbi:hypothetical protein ABFT80_00370 [Mesorhizobium sp. SB112]|uniref:hypothetical protein n=1 Tax=Mesorhizobium sp. SB112 TaxID=3151853 RepID=UPI003264D902
MQYENRQGKGISVETRVKHGGRVRLHHDVVLLFWVIIYVFTSFFTYVTLRNAEYHLYFGSYFIYEPSLLLLGVSNAIFILVPALWLFCRKSQNDLFCFVLLPLVAVGGICGSIVASLSDPYWWAIITSLYVVLPLALSGIAGGNFTRLKVVVGHDGRAILAFVGLIGAAFYFYLSIRYSSQLQLSGLKDAYSTRAEFASLVSGWERYGIQFSKYVSAFCAAAYAIERRKPLFLAVPLFIFIVDYLLAAHKISLAFSGLILVFYYWFAHRRLQFNAYYVPAALSVAQWGVLSVVGTSSAMGIWAVAFYDRLFMVSSGLFARYKNFADQNGYFWGGNGLLGRFFDGRTDNPTHTVGAYYWREGVSANADFISDAYINFGFSGILIAFVVLRLLLGRRDNWLYRDEGRMLITLMTPYALVLFSVGLQTAMISGGFVFGLILIKVFRFRKTSPL